MISSDLAGYTKPDQTPDVLQWGGIAFDEALKLFGFKATPRAVRRLREALAQGALTVHAEMPTGCGPGIFLTKC